MASIHTVLNACLYALISILLLTFAAVGCFLYRKYAIRAKVAAKLADIEANTKGKEQKQRLRLLILPASLDPGFYPSAARRSSHRLPSSERVIPSPFRSRFGNELPAVVDTTSRKAGQPKVDVGDNNNNSDQTSNDPVLIPSPPHRPPRPTLLDDLLAGFPYEHDVARDMWFPLADPGMARLELGVVRGARPASRYVQRNGSDGHTGVVLALKQGRREEDTRSIFSIAEDEVDNTPLTPSNTIVEVVTKKSEKQDERRKKDKKNGQPRVHVFEIPELYVNARPYEEIEAEEQARAAAALAAKEAEIEEATVERTIGL
ncbi:hypothetical protein APHAL10511_008149 [Amanita phalloides]|nr:hypothetical protein APHAL10511_008149 [Amanita phalloides]